MCGALTEPRVHLGLSAGILSFGQAAFFGLGGYAYAVGGHQHGGEHAADPGLDRCWCRRCSPDCLGYFMFYGRISNVYVGVITLTVTLILFNLDQFDGRATPTISEPRRSAASTASHRFRASTCPSISGHIFGPEENWYIAGRRA